MTNAILRGKSYAGNPHVAPTQCYGVTGRFEEGEVASAKPRRGSLLYNRAIVLGVALGACLTLSAADFTWVGNDSSSWQSEDSYAEAGKPGAGDTVIFQRGTAQQNSNATVTDADFDFVASLGAVKLDVRSTITFDVTGEKKLTIPVTAVTLSGRSNIIKLVKKGSGSLELASPGSTDYRLDLEVQEGVLLAPQDPAWTTGMNILSLTVAEGAVFYTPYAASLQLNGYVLSGSGLITNANPTAITSETDSRVISLNSAGGRFEGTIGGNLRLSVGISKGQAELELTGTNSTYAGWTDTYYGSRTGVVKFGNVGEPSSVGVNGLLGISAGQGGMLVCCGTEPQSTDKNIRFDHSGEHDAGVDAGAYGGVTFTGSWSYRGPNRRQHVVTLAGSNMVENVISGGFTEPYIRDESNVYHWNWSTYLRKTGTGVWRLADADGKGRALRGTIGVEDGTLRFDSIAEAGTACSLGMSTLTTGPEYDGQAADDPYPNGDKTIYAPRVPYAIALGGETTEGAFEYTGSKDAVCSTRPIAVQGPARLCNATDKNFFFENVFGIGDGAKTLTLDGESTTAVNTLTTVTNACGKLSIAKDGAGTWTLDKAVPNGSVAVHAGTLVFRRPGLVAAKDLDPADVRAETTFVPTWYRLTIKQNYQNWLENNVDKSVRSAGNSRSFILGEFALYDKDGKRLNAGFKYMTDDGVWTSGSTTYKCDPITKLSAGEIGLEYGSCNQSARNPGQLVNGTNTSTGFQGTTDPSVSMGSSEYMGTWLPKSWIKVVMRLPEGSPAVAAYDYANDDCSSSALTSRQRQIYAYEIEGSLDGVNWHSLTNVDGAAENVTAGCWNSDDTAVSHADRPGCGYVIDSRLSAQPGQSSFDLVESVSVDAGATLKADCADGVTFSIKGLTVDPTKGAGTIDGFAFAETGTFNLTKLPLSGSKYKFTLTNCTGFENVADWSVRLDGQETGKYEIGVSEDGSVTIFRKGALVIIK